MNILEQVKKLYKDGSILVKLIFINVGFFVLVNLLFAFSVDIVYWFSVPASGVDLLLRPWTAISYMFLHKDLMHILFNMLWLFWFGTIFLKYLDPKKMLSVYLLGGLSGAGLFIIFFNLVPQFSANGAYALGASAAVMAIVIATATYAPNLKLKLMFIGEVKLKHIALFVIGLDILGALGENNVGGHVAHLGGAVYGFFYTRELQKGRDIAAGFAQFIDKLIAFVSKKKIKIAHKNNKAPRNDREYNKWRGDRQAKIDRILDKISKYGYDKLSQEEKDFLFRESDRK